MDDLDLTKAQRPGEEQQRVNADLLAHLLIFTREASREIGHD